MVCKATYFLQAVGKFREKTQRRLRTEAKCLGEKNKNPEDVLFLNQEK